VGVGTWLVNPADAAIDEVVVLDAIDPVVDRSQRLSDGRTAVHVRVPALGVAPLESQPVADRVVLVMAAAAIAWAAAGLFDDITGLRLGCLNTGIS
jgi:hypothetical protein